MWTRRLFLPLLNLALWRTALGGRQSDDNSVAVDTGAHFIKNGFDQRHLDSVDASDEDDAQSDEDQSEEDTLNSATIEKLGHQIAKELAHELQRGHHHRHIEPHRQAQQEEHHRHHLPHKEEGPMANAAALLEELSQASHAKADEAARLSHALDAEEAEEASRYGSTTETASVALQQDLKNFSKALDNVAALKKSADTSFIASQLSMHEAQSTAQQTSAATVPASVDKSQLHVGTSLQELARLFQPIQNSADAHRLGVLSSPKKHSNDLPLKANASKHRNGGLADVAGDLLELKAVMETQSQTQKMQLVKGDPDADKLPTWDQLDPAGKGSLTKEDFKNLVGDDVSDLDDIFKEIDRNGSGFIDREEYNRAIQDGVLRAKIVAMFEGGTFVSVRPHILLLLFLLLSAPSSMAW